MELTLGRALIWPQHEKDRGYVYLPGATVSFMKSSVVIAYQKCLPCCELRVVVLFSSKCFHGGFSPIK